MKAVIANALRFMGATREPDRAGEPAPAPTGAAAVDVADAPAVQPYQLLE